MLTPRKVMAASWWLTRIHQPQGLSGWNRLEPQGPERDWTWGSLHMIDTHTHGVRVKGHPRSGCRYSRGPDECYPAWQLEYISDIYLGETRHIMWLVPAPIPRSDWTQLFVTPCWTKKFITFFTTEDTNLTFSAFVKGYVWNNIPNLQANKI